MMAPPVIINETAGKRELEARIQARAVRQQAAQKRHVEEARAKPEPVLTTAERQASRAERTARAPQLREQRRHSPAAFTPRERQKRLTPSQRIAALEAEVAALKGGSKKS
jgi:hypothetical protein